MKKSLNQKQRRFCAEYVFDWNATRAYRTAYATKKDSVAASCATKLLRNAHIKAHIESIKEDYEKLCGVSKAGIIRNLVSIAFSSMSQFHNSWITLAQFDALTDQQKACIESIESEVFTKVVDKELYEITKLKIKLHSKLTASDQINKLMGYYSAEKVDLTQKEDTRGKSIDELRERLRVLRELKKQNDSKPIT